MHSVYIYVKWSLIFIITTVKQHAKCNYLLNTERGLTDPTKSEYLIALLLLVVRGEYIDRKENYSMRVGCYKTMQSLREQKGKLAALLLVLRVSYTASLIEGY